MIVLVPLAALGASAASRWNRILTLNVLYFYQVVLGPGAHDLRSKDTLLFVPKTLLSHLGLDDSTSGMLQYMVLITRTRR